MEDLSPEKQEKTPENSSASSPIVEKTDGQPSLDKSKSDRSRSGGKSSKRKRSSKNETIEIPRHEWDEFKKQNDRILKLLNEPTCKSRKLDSDDNEEHYVFSASENSESEDGEILENRDDAVANDLEDEINGLANNDPNNNNRADNGIEEIAQEYNDDEDVGPEIDTQLANLVEKMKNKNMPDDTQKRINDTYKLPQNCNNLCVPKVNEELWSELDKDVKIQDLRLQKIQRHLIKSAAILIKTAQNLIGKAEFRNAMDALAMTLKNMKDISFDRKIVLTNGLHPKFKKLLSPDIPVTKYLFGDDFAGTLKSINVSSKLGKNFSKSTKGKKYFPKNGERPSQGTKNWRASNSQASNQGRYQRRSSFPRSNQSYQSKRPYVPVRGGGRGRTSTVTKAMLKQ